MTASSYCILYFRGWVKPYSTQSCRARTFPRIAGRRRKGGGQSFFFLGRLIPLMLVNLEEDTGGASHLTIKVILQERGTTYSVCCPNPRQLLYEKLGGSAPCWLLRTLKIAKYAIGRILCSIDSRKTQDFQQRRLQFLHSL